MNRYFSPPGFLFSAFTALAALSLLAACCGKKPDQISVKDGSERQDAVRISSEGVAGGEPAIAADRAGNEFVVWVEHSPDQGADVFVRKYDASGRAVGDKVRVDPVAGSATAWRGDPPTLAVGNDHTVYVGWTRKYDDKAIKGNDLLLSVSRDGGLTFADPVKVNDDTKPASHGMHSMTVEENGRVHMVWLDERNITNKHPETVTSMSMMHHEEAEPNSEVYYTASSDGGKTFTANKKLASEVCPCCKTSMVVSPDGTVYAAWRQVLPGDYRHIAVSHSTDGGKTFSEGVIVSDDRWQINACPVSGAALAADKNNVLLVAWYTAGKAGQPGLYFSRSRDGGKSFPNRQLISLEMIGGTPVFPSGGGEPLSVVFAGVNNAVLSAVLPGNRDADLSTNKIADASLPASVMSNGQTHIAFVRNVGETSSVWLVSESQ
jgi:hypothetical protein